MSLLLAPLFFTVVRAYGYIYPNPEPPIQFDEPSTPQTLYGPPSYYPNISFPPLQDDPVILNPAYIPPPPGGDLQPPQFDDPIVIPPPVHDQYLPPTLYAAPKTPPLQVTIANMSCLDTPGKKFFRTEFKTSQFLDAPPVVEDLGAGECVFGAGDRFRMELEGGKMAQCGVRYCQGRDRLNLCVTLRMATVRGLKLPEDAVVTMQCRPQDNVVAHTKQFRLNSQSVQGRSAATIAAGGSQRSFETQVGLFRKPPGSSEFTQAVTPGSAVQLGEELMLRASVRDGDGWKFSRMGSVVMHRITPLGKNAPRASQNSATMVDASGCRTAAMKSVCPENPRQVTPLVTVLPFRAFMFQGARSGEEMVLTVRMLGCLQFEDCDQVCEDRAQRTRAKRETHAKDNVTDWQSYVEFKVVSGDPGEEVLRRSASPVIGVAIFGAFSASVLVLVAVAFAVKRCVF